MADDETDIPDTTPDVTIDESPAYAGMADVVELFNTFNSTLDVTVQKLAVVAAKVDELVSKMSQLDVSKTSTGEAGAPVSQALEAPEGYTYSPGE